MTVTDSKKILPVRELLCQVSELYSFHLAINQEIDSINPYIAAEDIIFQLVPLTAISLL